jgi:hypothetical protein
MSETKPGTPTSDNEWLAEISETRCHGGPVPAYYTQTAFNRVRAHQKAVMADGGLCPSLASLWRDGDLDREKTLANLPPKGDER